MPIQTSGDPYAIAKTLRKGKEVHHDSDEVGGQATNALKERLSIPGTGKMYTVEFFTDSTGTVHPVGQRDPHRASRPGSAPAPDSGDLRRSVSHAGSRNAGGAEVEIGSHADHAVYTEFGTSKMRARPWFRPTMQKIRLRLTKPWEKGIVARERAEARRLGGRG